MPWQLADRSDSGEWRWLFQHSAERLHQHNKKTLPDSSRSNALLEGNIVQRFATRTRRHKDKRRKRKPLRRCELTCEPLPCKLKAFSNQRLTEVYGGVDVCLKRRSSRLTTDQDCSRENGLQKNIVSGRFIKLHGIPITDGDRFGDRPIGRRVFRRFFCLRELGGQDGD